MESKQPPPARQPRTSTGIYGKIGMGPTVPSSSARSDSAASNGSVSAARRAAAAAAVESSANMGDDTPYDRYQRDMAVLTEQNTVGQDIKERQWERRKYSFQTREELALRVATTMVTGRYELPKFFAQNTETTFLGRVGAQTQTQIVTTRDVGLGDGDIDALAPERTIDIPLNMPEVSEFPILSLPQQLEAERRLVSLLARVEEEIHRCAEELKRNAANDAKKIEATKYKQSLYCDTAEWENRMLSAITTRMRDKHRGIEDNFSRDHDLQAYLRQHRLEMENKEEQAKRVGRDRTSSPAGSPSRMDFGGGSLPGNVIPQPLTPAVQHILKVKPILKGNVEEMKALVKASKENRNGGENEGDARLGLGGAAVGRNPSVSGNGKPMSRGMQIALSSQRFFTPKEQQQQYQQQQQQYDSMPPSLSRDGRSTSFYNNTSQNGGGGGFGDRVDSFYNGPSSLSPSLAPSGGAYDGGSFRQLPARRGGLHRNQSDMHGGGGRGGGGDNNDGNDFLANTYSGGGANSFYNNNNTGDHHDPLSNTVSLSQQSSLRPSTVRSGGLGAGFGGGGVFDDVGGSAYGGNTNEHSPAPDRGDGDGFSGYRGGGGRSSANTLNAPSESTAATVSPSPAAYGGGGADYPLSSYTFPSNAGADLINAGIGSPPRNWTSSNQGGTGMPSFAGGGGGSSGGLGGSSADIGGAALRTNSGSSVNAAIDSLVNDDHSPGTRANRRAAGNALIAGIDGLDEVKSKLGKRNE